MRKYNGIIITAGSKFIVWLVTDKYNHTLRYAPIDEGLPQLYAQWKKGNKYIPENIEWLEEINFNTANEIRFREVVSYLNEANEKGELPLPFYLPHNIQLWRRWIENV